MATTTKTNKKTVKKTTKSVSEPVKTKKKATAKVVEAASMIETEITPIEVTESIVQE